MERCENEPIKARIEKVALCVKCPVWQEHGRWTDLPTSCDRCPAMDRAKEAQP